MAANRYWRAVCLVPYGMDGLALSEFHLLLAGVRVDAPATLTASTLPTEGAVGNIKDDALGTSARWAQADLSTLVLQWDFGGAPTDVSDIQLAGDSDTRFLLSVGIQGSSDALEWVEALTRTGIAWPGPGAKTSLSDPAAKWDRYNAGSGVVVGADEGLMVSRIGTTGHGMVSYAAGIMQFEVTVVSMDLGAAVVGVCTTSAGLEDVLGNLSNCYGYASSGQKYLAGAITDYSATYTTGDTIGVVVDFAVGSLTFYKNGVSQGVAAATTMKAKVLFPAASNNSYSQIQSSQLRLRSRDFLYPVAGASPWIGVPSLSKNRVPGGIAATSVPGDVRPSSDVTEFGIPSVVPTPATTAFDGLTGVFGKGVGRIAGTVKEKGTPDAPVYRKVRLIREVDGLQLREVWSHPVTGAYSFDYVDEQQLFTVLSYDHTGDFRAVVASGLTPELIP